MLSGTFLSQQVAVGATRCWSWQWQHLVRIASRTSCIISVSWVLQVAIFVFAVWSGTTNGGVIAGLAVAGFVMAATSSAGTLMQARGISLIRLESVTSCFRCMAFLPLIPLARPLAAASSAWCITYKYNLMQLRVQIYINSLSNY